MEDKYILQKEIKIVVECAICERRLEAKAQYEDEGELLIWIDVTPGHRCIVYCPTCKEPLTTDLEKSAMFHKHCWEDREEVL